MNKIKIVSRNSNLAIKQVHELMKNINTQWELSSIASFGDKNKNISLMNNQIKDFFTREIDEAILLGIGDIAIHSAKDLPYPLHPNLEVVALTQAFDQTDSLVSKNGIKLKDLSKGSKIGTSSPQRESQIIQINPDVEIFSIRGTIEERIKQLDDGVVDGVIIATCALKRLNLKHRISEVLDFKTHALQGMLAVTAKRNNLYIRNLFSSVNILNSYGTVDLIGFGPGNPELLTIQAHNRLSKADIIFYDALLPRDFINKYQGEKVFVGKRAGNHSFLQDEIQEMLYQAAISGKNVARLKGGDPFIFGRGGEEVDYLMERFVTVNTTPGITAAQGASASLNIPLTQRGVSDGVELITAQKGELVSKSRTRVYYMGGTKVSEIKDELLKMGEAENTPVLLVENATLYNQFEIKTTINEMDKTSPKLPVILICGDISKSYEPQKYILNTGLRDKNYSLKGRLIHYPLIKIEYLEFSIDIDEFETILFTSITAVNYLTSRVDLKSKKIISLGSGTSDAIKSKGLNVDFQGTSPDSDTLYQELLEKNYKKILYPCSALSENKLVTLDDITALPVYNTILNEPEHIIDLDRVEGIIFTSPSTVDNFVKIYKEIPDIDIFCFGKFTENRINKYKKGLNVQTI